MPLDETSEVMLEFVRSFVDREAAALAAIVADDCVIEAVAPSPDGEIIEGKDACLAFWQAMAGHSHTTFELEQTIAGEDVGTVLWRYRFGPGEPESVRGALLLHVSDRLIRFAQGYSKAPANVTIGF